MLRRPGGFASAGTQLKIALKRAQKNLPKCYADVPISRFVPWYGASHRVGTIRGSYTQDGHSRPQLPKNPPLFGKPRPGVHLIKLRARNGGPPTSARFLVSPISREDAVSRRANLLRWSACASLSNLMLADGARPKKGGCGRAGAFQRCEEVLYVACTVAWRA